LAGLKDGIRDKVLEAAKATFNESVKVARNLETIQNDHKRLNKINAIRNEMEEEKAKEIPWDSLSDDQLAQLAAIRFGRNRYNNNGNNNGNNNRNNQGNNRPTQLRNPNTECRYCKRKDICRKIVSPGNATKLQWSTPMANLTSRTTASTTSPTNQLLPKLPQPPDTKTPLSGQSQTSVLTTI